MQISSAPGAMTELLAPSAAASEPRPAESTASATNGETAAFTAMLAAMVSPPAAAPAQPSLDDEAVDAEASESAEEPAAEHAPTGAESQSMDALLYGLRTDAQLGGLADELASAPAPRQPEQAPSDAAVDAHARRDARAAASAHGQSGRSDATAFAGSGVARRTRAGLTERAAPVADDAPSAHATGGVPAADAPTAAPAPTGRPEANVAALDPELQDRLARVVDRMRDEFGHDVEIVETTRSQARQDQLFAQGRTGPGPVVTWTRSSQHTLGRAVDVRIDGGWEDTEAFRLLQRIAREEGLRTLGPRDAGHLELARDAAPSAARADADAAPADHGPRHAPSVAHAAPSSAVAQVAAVATVAEVAEVAQVAAVTQPGAAPVQAAAQAATRETTALRGDAVATRASRRRATDDASREERDGAPGLSVAATTAAATQAPRAAGSAAPALGAAAVERMTRVTDQIEAGSANEVSHLTLRIDNADGGQDQIRIDLRGLTVDTQIDVADAATAERLNGRLGELRDALGRQGLSADTVTISAAGARAADATSAANGASADAGRAAAAVAAAGRPQDAGASSSGSQQQSGSQPPPERDPLLRDGARDSQHGAHDDRRGRDAEPWFTDDAPVRGRTRGRTR